MEQKHHFFATIHHSFATGRKLRKKAMSVRMIQVAPILISKLGGYTFSPHLQAHQWQGQVVLE
jgi:hypothetical protein